MTRTTIGAALALALAAPAAAEVVQSSPTHFVVRDSATVKAAPKAAWLMLIDPAQWWEDAHTWSGKATNLTLVPQGGGCFCERIPEKDSAAAVGLSGSAQHMTVVMAEPMKVLRMRGGLGPLQSEPVDGVLTITMQADKASGGTRIVLEYVVGGTMRFEVAKISQAVDGVMSTQLGRLADKLGRVDAPAASKTAPAPAKDAAAKDAPAKEAPAKDAAPKADPKKDASSATSQDVGAALDAMGSKPKSPK